MVREGTFREDLYYRINTMHLHLPPLRDREDEIVSLAENFTASFSEKYKRNVTGLAPDTIGLLKSHRWNGNIRELQNCIEKAVILSENSLLLPSDISLPPASPYTQDNFSGEDSLEDTEEKTIRAAMNRFEGNLSMVAKSLKISRPTLYSKLKKYDI